MPRVRCTSQSCNIFIVYDFESLDANVDLKLKDFKVYMEDTKHLPETEV